MLTKEEVKQGSVMKFADLPISPDVSGQGQILFEVLGQPGFIGRKISDGEAQAMQQEGDRFVPQEDELFPFQGDEQVMITWLT